MRPKAIVTFERLFLLSIVLSTVQLALEAGARIGQAGPVTEFVAGAAAILVSVVLVLLASRKRSNVARWLLVLFTVLGLAAVGFDLGQGGEIDTPWLISLLAVALQTAAVAMLFSPQAREWFGRRDSGAT